MGIFADIFGSSSSTSPSTTTGNTTSSGTSSITGSSTNDSVTNVGATSSTSTTSTNADTGTLSALVQQLMAQTTPQGAHAAIAQIYNAADTNGEPLINNTVNASGARGGSSSYQPLAYNNIQVNAAGQVAQLMNSNLQAAVAGQTDLANLTKTTTTKTNTSGGVNTTSGSSSDTGTTTSSGVTATTSTNSGGSTQSSGLLSNIINSL